MKTVLTKFLTLGSAALLMLSACKKDGALVTSNGGKPGALTASTTTPVLDKTKLSDATPIVSFTFAAPNYGFSAAVTNTLQIDAAGDNWKNPMSVTLANKVYSQSYSTSDFNALLLKLNLVGGVTSQVQVRIANTISASVAPIYSNVISLTVTPFNLTSWLYITGAFSGWANPGPAEDSLFSATSNGIYTGIINFNATGSGANQFLVLPAKNWNNKYATSGSGTPSSTITYNASNNFNAPAANGWYLVTFNLNSNTISFEQVNSYSVIGSVTAGGNWSTDDELKFINSTDQAWEGVLSFTAGQFKFRQDNDWTWSWGDISSPDGTDATDSNGGNINVAAAGNYWVTFAIPASPFGTSPPPPVTAKYTLTKQ